jgi:hypothetical protein
MRDLTVTIGVSANGHQFNYVPMYICTGHHFSGAQRESEIGIEICRAVIEFDVE